MLVVFALVRMLEVVWQSTKLKHPQAALKKFLLSFQVATVCNAGLASIQKCSDINGPISHYFCSLQNVIVVKDSMPQFPKKKNMLAQLMQCLPFGIGGCQGKGSAQQLPEFLQRWWLLGVLLSSVIYIMLDKGGGALRNVARELQPLKTMLPTK